VSWRSALADWIDPGPRYGERFANDFPQTPATAYVPGSDAWSSWFGNPGVPGLPLVSEQTALTVSAIFSCVNLIAGAIAALTTQIYRRAAEGEHEQIYGDPLWWMLNEEFCPRWNAANGMEYIAQSLLLHGDGLAIINRKAGLNLGAIAGLDPVHPIATTILPTPDYKRLIYVITRPWGAVEVYDQDDVLHIPGFGFNGFRGLSPLRNHLRMTGAVALATQEFAARFFSNGARSDFVIKSEQKLSPEDAAMIRDMYLENHQGLSNSHRPMVLGQGADVKALTLPLEDAQLLETRRFAVEEICRIYGVPPFMIAQMEKTTSWGSGVETMGQGFVRFTLRQHLTKIEKEINRKFFRTAGKFVEFDTFELERANMEALFNSFSTAIGGQGKPGFMTAEEVRNKLNLPRSPKHGALATADTGTGAANAPQAA
jgi:HK97 family phage portal protein